MPLTLIFHAPSVGHLGKGKVVSYIVHIMLTEKVEVMMVMAPLAHEEEVVALFNFDM